MLKRILLLTALFLLPSSFAHSFDALEILSGWFTADIREDRTYQGAPILVSFDFHAAPLLKKAGIHVDDNLDLALEPFVAAVLDPGKNMEAGVNILFKYTFPLAGSIRPYIKGGSGILYMSQHTLEQSTQINFLPQIGVGAHFFLDANTALSLEYRLRHLSNCSLKEPNKGIDADLYLAGLSFFF